MEFTTKYILSDFPFSKCQEPVRRETTDNSPIEYAATRAHEPVKVRKTPATPRDFLAL